MVDQRYEIRIVLSCDLDKFSCCRVDRFTLVHTEGLTNDQGYLSLGILFFALVLTYFFAPEKKVQS